MVKRLTRLNRIHRKKFVVSIQKVSFIFPVLKFTPFLEDFEFVFIYLFNLHDTLFVLHKRLEAPRNRHSIV